MILPYLDSKASLVGVCNNTTLVGRLVEAAIPKISFLGCGANIRLPRSSLDLIKMYGISLVSHWTGRWDSTSTGETSAAKIHMPLAPFLIDLPTSLTPLLTFFCLITIWD